MFEEGVAKKTEKLKFPKGSCINFKGIRGRKGMDPFQGVFFHSSVNFFKSTDCCCRYGMPHGRVEWRLPSGLRMDGMFRMGRPHGFVRVYDDEGGLVFEGR